MKSLKLVGAFAVGAACFWLAANQVMARGYGQGEHEVDSGVGSLRYGGGANTNYADGGVGQGQEGPGGSNGAYVLSGANSLLAGQGQHEAGGELQAAPVFDVTPAAEQGSMIATVQPDSGVRIAADPNYRFANGMWFYQMPNNRWVRWENGAWAGYNSSAIASQNSGVSASRTFSYEPSKDSNNAKDNHAQDNYKNAQKHDEQKATQPKSDNKN
jgi:hypothetical protein